MHDTWKLKRPGGHPQPERRNGRGKYVEFIFEAGATPDVKVFSAFTDYGESPGVRTPEGTQLYHGPIRRSEDGA